MEEAYWADEQESGPPTVEDDAWFQHHVVSKGYSKVKREPKQLPGQQKLSDAPSCNCGEFRIGDQPVRHHPAYCEARRSRS